MRKVFAILLVTAGVACLGLYGCTDAGDPNVPEGPPPGGGTWPAAVTVTVEDYVGAWDNLHVNGDLTGGTPVAMSADGLDWSADVMVDTLGSYIYNLFTDDGSKAMVQVGGPYSIDVDNEGNGTGDTEVELEGDATDGFRITVHCYNTAYDNIKFKGAVWNTDWSTVERDGASDDLTVFYRNVAGGSLAEGTYEWGAINDDGTEDGQWLMPSGPNYAVAVDAQGGVTGNLDYLIEAPEPEATLTLNCDMNAFEGTFTTVHTRGTFNGWAQAPTDLADPDEDGIWTVVLDVEQNAEIIFKFIVDGSSYEDVPPACGADDGYGGYNRSFQMGTESGVFTAPFAGCPAVK